MKTPEIVTQLKQSGAIEAIKVMWKFGKKFLSSKYIKMIQPFLESMAIEHFEALKKQYPDKDIIFMVVPHEGTMYYATCYMEGEKFVTIARYDPVIMADVIRVSIDKFINEEKITKKDSTEPPAIAPIY